MLWSIELPSWVPAFNWLKHQLFISILIIKVEIWHNRWETYTTNSWEIFRSTDLHEKIWGNGKHGSERSENWKLKTKILKEFLKHRHCASVYELLVKIVQENKSPEDYYPIIEDQPLHQHSIGLRDPFFFLNQI